ncbi:MAG: hypothetical protein Q8P57_04970 [Candidatus Pacearchaeota archaeon]|nr:hypothetical protein [Candidatus Pacearchaeota archaeon]
MKFNFRKIASALASTAMVGSTIALAAAASYPAPFVQNGASNVAIVYGENLDLSAVTSITSDLSAALASAGATATTVSSDAYPLFTSSTPLQLNASINSVRTTVTESNLPAVLTDTSFSGDVEANVEFKIVPGSNPRVVFGSIPTSNDDPTVGVTFSSSSGSYLYNSTITFNKIVMLNHTDSEGETINLFGQDFVVSAATDGTDLVLFKSAMTLDLSIGGGSDNPSEVVVIDGETYTVELTSATDTSATIRVTDSSGNSDSKKVNEAQSKKIQGLEVAVDTAHETTALASVGAQILVGANRLTLTDASTVSQGTDAVSIDGTNVDYVLGQNPGNLTTLTIQAFAPDGDSDAIRSGGAFVDPVFGSFRLALTGLSIETDDTENRETISLGVSGNDKMNIGFTNWQGNSLNNFQFINNESSAWGKRFLGDSSDWQIFTSEMAKINSSAYSVVGNEETGLLVKLSQLTNSSGTPIYTSDKVVFQNAFDTTQTWEAQITSEGTGTITIAGIEYDVTYRYDKSDNVDNDQYVQLDNKAHSTGNAMVLYPTIETNKGANLMFYEPLTIDLGNWKGEGGVNVSSFKIPDGDGYTEIFAAPNGSGGALAGIEDGVWNFSLTAADLGSATIVNHRTFNVTAGAGLENFTFAVGQLTFGVYSTTVVGTAAGSPYTTGKSSNNTVIIQLNDTVSGNANPITGPAIVLFEEQDENNVYEAVVVEFSGNGDSNNGIGVSDVDFSWNKDADMVDGSTYGASGFQRDSDEDLYDMMDLWGTLVTTDRSTSDQYTAEISYPETQVVAELYFDSLEGTGATTTLGDVKIMDSDLIGSGMETKNLIVVGGSCVNTAAYTLVGASGNGCGPQWTAATGAGAGEYVIETFANPWAATKVATLVAGYEQGDTLNAAQYLTTQTGVSTDVGTKLKGTTANAATLVTA